MNIRSIVLSTCMVIGVGCIALSSLAVSTDLQMPGTQPFQAGYVEPSYACTGCHGWSNRQTEIAHNWRGSMMANAARDPIFWATMAVGEQDFPGSGDFCIRCHSTSGWYNGRAVPSDGSALNEDDVDGIHCDTCHRMSNPDFSEHQGEMMEPYVANDHGTPAKGYYGSGMLSLMAPGTEYGPYADALPHHLAEQSLFHRSSEFCGSCHDVSNPAVGDLAIGNGTQSTADPVVFSGVPGSPVAGKAAFNNFPHKFGIAERTFSEHMSSAFRTLTVTNYASLPADLKGGAIKIARDNALLAGTNGNYADGTPRKFTCQSCHMPPVVGEGTLTGDVPTRNDLPLHDLTGANTVAPELLLKQDQMGTLRFGGGLIPSQIDAIQDAQGRARQTLRSSATLQVNRNTLKIINQTGHKLISGYPEGRRMWLNIKWFSSRGVLLREDGKYGPISTIVNGIPTTVDSLLNLNDPNTKVYEVKMGMTAAWANQLISLGYSPTLPVVYDRNTGAPSLTLGTLASGSAGPFTESFRFLLNNFVISDNRIPPYGMQYEEARKRNVLPVPATQYGNPGPSGTYQYWDQITLNPPAGAASATIDLMYQTISWEYLQFLLLANNGSSAFLGNDGTHLYDAWRSTGMGKPEKITSAIWGGGKMVIARPPMPPSNLTATPGDASVDLSWTPANGPVSGYLVLDYQAGKTKVVASVASTATTYTVSGIYSGFTYTYTLASWRDQNLNGTYDADIDILSPITNTATAMPQ